MGRVRDLRFSGAMGARLLPHNRRAYEAAVWLLQETGRAEVVHPTSMGKSFVDFQLAEGRILWLPHCPNLAGSLCPHCGYGAGKCPLLRCASLEALDS